MKNNQTINTGIGFLPMLFLVLLVLKLTNYINWPWWIITMPLWGCLALFFIVGITILGFAFFCGLRKHYKIKKSNEFKILP